MKHQDDEANSERQSLTQAPKPEQESIYNDVNTSSATLKKDLKTYNKKKYILIGLGILLLLILIIVLPIVLTRKGGDSPSPSPTPVPPIEPGDNPYQGDSSNITINSDTVSGQIKAKKNTTTYFQKSIDKFLLEANVSKQLGVDWKKIPFGDNNNFTETLNFTFDMVGKKIARLVLTNADEQRFSIPEDILPKPQSDSNMHLEMVGFNFSASPFAFSFHDVADTDNIFLTTQNQSMVFSDKFIQMDFKLPTQRIYGFGERVHEFQLQDGAYTMWASGQDNIYDDGKGRKGLSGVHPFLLVQTQKSGEYIGIFFRNANAQTPILRKSSDGGTILSYITIAGQLEVYFFVHGTAKSVIQDYQNFIGKPNLPPFWSLGWQEASYINSTQAAIEESIAAYQTAGLPLETVYLDLNSVNTETDFTLNTENIDNIASLTETLKNNSQKLIAYLSSAISAQNVANNKYYTNGDGLFIKSTMHPDGTYNGNLVNMQAQKKVVYIDWFNETCSDFWQSSLKDYSSQFSFDGLWTTMNEPFGQIHGEVDQSITPPQSLLEVKRMLADPDFDLSWFYSFNQSEISTFMLPFVPQYGAENVGNYDNQTLSLNGTHMNGTSSEYDLHSLYSLAMAKQSFNYLTNSSDERPFFITRGTFAGSGSYASYAITNNWRDWKYLKYSIAGLMNMNMFGIPHVGADVCGFHGSTLDEELCLRWIQLATFYPLARHNQNFTYFEDSNINRTEPYMITNDTYKAHVKASMYDRYQYLRLMYTCLFEASQWGGTCIDPLFFYYPTDLNTYFNYEDSFLVAGALKVSPVLSQTNASTFTSYFPEGKWVNLANLSEFIDGQKQNHTLQILPTVNVHLRPGSLIPYQNNSDYSINVTAQLLEKPISIIVNRDDNGFATGTVLMDQGSSRKEITDKQYGYYKINVQNNSIQVQLADGIRDTMSHEIDKVVIANAEDLFNTSFACYMSTNLSVSQLNHTYNETTKTLELSSDTPLSLKTLMNVYYGNSSNLNLCNAATFEYTIEDGIIPNLTAQNVSIKLKHELLPSIQVDIGFFDVGIVNIKWNWALDSEGKYPSGKRVQVEVPDEVVNTTKRVIKNQDETLNKYITIANEPFRIDFLQRQNGTKVPYLSVTGMIFDSYMNWINVEAHIPNKDEFKGILGLGERATKDLFFKDGVYSLWSTDVGNPDEDGKLPGKQTYGVHPFYMYRHAANNWVGVFYKLAHAQDWWIKNDADNGKVDIKTIANGGIADIYILTSSQQPDSILSKYYQIVGKPVLIPQWSLGWNQCKWCYKNTTQIKDVVSKYEEYSIPLDTQWVDIDYMDNYKDFTYDNTSFGDLPDFVTYLHQNKSMKFIPIIDAGIAFRPNENYSAYDEGVTQNVFIKLNDKNFMGEVWPNEAVYPDFSHPNATSWWHSQLDTFHSKIAFDGLWQDMNEASNFCNGVCHNRQQVTNPIKQSPIYTPTGQDLETKSISLDASHYDGALEFDAHSYFGTRQVKASHEWFQNQTKRTMIVSRSSFAGMGKYGSKWTGDNHATVEDMAKSVVAVMQMNIFGIPLAGADICGYAGKTTNELCTRWHQVGAFYPFSRNHHSCDGYSQEPYLFSDSYSEDLTYTDIMRTAIQTKYHLIRYIYSELLQVSFFGNKAFYKPVFFAFPDDMNAYENVTNNVMLGDYLKLSINSEDLTAAETDFYFPSGVWCNILEPSKEKCFNSSGEVITKASTLTDFYVHMRQGSIIPLQNATSSKALTTVDLQKQPIDLHILGEQQTSSAWRAQYIYVNDDGETTDFNNKSNVYDITAKYTRNESDATNETIVIAFQMIHKAEAYYNNETKCSNVNQNDYLNTIYIYYASSFKKNDQYNVTATYDDQTTEDLGSASYETTSDRIVFTAEANICMTRVEKLTFTPKTTSI